ncbi:energy-coupling factor transporter transmembrane component T family protein [Sciscionella marina]|uniref:energy-coupling factor transporter transmembrane component T family protein n=1 Tax=Sciscionella marina TaxID=508770 RepID=UPI0003738C80|nr:energy-coupling factor transporter transmembrane protein EcfT [Sciscionella marina]
MTPLGLYEPGASPLHRAGAGWKLLGILALAIAAFVLRDPLWLGVLAAVAVLGYPIARIPSRRCLQSARTFGVLVVVVFALQWLLLGLDGAIVVGLRLVTALAAANLYTLTTRIVDVIGSVERGLGPLRRIGLRPERLGLLVGLTVQAVGTLAGIAGEVREAAKARDAGWSATAFAVPFLVRTLRHADELGEALAARGEGER